MTGENMNDFIGQIANAYRALQAEPKLRDEIDTLNSMVESYAKQVQEREISLLERAKEIDELHSRIRSLEVERDDYGFRALAADDKANALAAVLRSTQATVEAALKAAEPEPTVIETSTVPDGAAQAVVSSETHSGGIAPSTERSADLMADWAARQEQGQRAADPISAASPVMASNPQDGAVIPIVETTAVNTSQPDYSRSLYINHPGWVSREDWLAGGGTTETYDWREGDPLPDGWSRGADGTHYRF